MGKRAVIILCILLASLISFGQLAETNLTITAIKTYIGSSSNNLKALCTDASVNRWSKKKPIRIRNSNPSEWYKASDGKFGLQIFETTLLNLTPSTESQLNYIAPNDANGYRQGDYRGYWKLANEFISCSGYPSGTYYEDDNPQFDYTKIVGNSNNVTAKDLGYGEYYFGVMLYFGTDTAYITDSDSLAISDKNSFVLNLDGSFFDKTEGTYTWKSFICEEEIRGLSGNDYWVLKDDLTLSQELATIVTTQGTTYGSSDPNTGTFTVLVYSLSVAPTSWQFANTSGDSKVFVVTATSGMSWTASLIFSETPTNWVAFDGSSTGTGNGSITLETQQGGSPDKEHVATLRFTSNATTVDIPLTQAKLN